MRTTGNHFTSTEPSSVSSCSEPHHVLLAPSIEQYSGIVRRLAAASSPRRDSSSTEIGTSTSSNGATLVSKLIGDVVVAAAVTGAVAPALAIVDKALVQRSTGSHTLLQSAWSTTQYLARHPVMYLKSPTFLWLWGTYACTYAAANSLRTLTDHYEETTQEEVSSSKSNATSASSSSTSSAALFLGTTMVNSTTSLMKDRAYAKLFGNAVQNAGVPAVSYALWMSRDLTVVGSSFLLPPVVAQWIQERTSIQSQDQALKIAQVASPVGAQLVAGPLHFVGLDWYNRPQSTISLADRLRFLQRGLVEVVGARMLRFLPGYGLAGVWNRDLRNAWHRQVADNKNNNNKLSIPFPNMPELMQQPMLLRQRAATYIQS